MAIMIPSLFLVQKRKKEKRKSLEEKAVAVVVGQEEEGQVDVLQRRLQEQIKKQYEKNMENIFCHVVHARSVVSHVIVVV